MCVVCAHTLLLKHYLYKRGVRFSGLHSHYIHCFRNCKAPSPNLVLMSKENICLDFFTVGNLINMFYKKVIVIFDGLIEQLFRAVVDIFLR